MRRQAAVVLAATLFFASWIAALILMSRPDRFVKDVIEHLTISPWLMPTGGIDAETAGKSAWREATVTGWLECVAEEGEFGLRVEVRQGGATGEGVRVGRCNGVRERWEVVVMAQGSTSFTTGAAEACAYVEPVGDTVRARPKDQRSWCAQVELVES